MDLLPNIFVETAFFFSLMNKILKEQSKRTVSIWDKILNIIMKEETLTVLTFMYLLLKLRSFHICAKKKKSD